MRPAQADHRPAGCDDAAVHPSMVREATALVTANATDVGHLAPFVGESHQLEPGAESQLVEDAPQVGFYGGFRDKQGLRHHAAAEAFGCK